MVAVCLQLMNQSENDVSEKSQEIKRISRRDSALRIQGF